MKRYVIPALILGIALVIAGCTAPAPGGSTPAPTPSPSTPVPTATTTVSPTVTATATPDIRACTADSDCVQEQCCHPTGCINRKYKQVCTLLCTNVCEGPIDCGAGHCGCVNGTCGVVPGR